MNFINASLRSSHCDRESRIRHCCSCGVACRSGSDLIPGRGTSMCCGREEKKKKISSLKTSSDSHGLHRGCLGGEQSRYSRLDRLALKPHLHGSLHRLKSLIMSKNGGWMEISWVLKCHSLVTTTHETKRRRWLCTSIHGFKKFLFTPFPRSVVCVCVLAPWDPGDSGRSSSMSS